MAERELNFQRTQLADTIMFKGKSIKYTRTWKDYQMNACVTSVSLFFMLQFQLFDFRASGGEQSKADLQG